jgi:hypothetical protein
VFVDAVGTGLLEAIAPNVQQTFWSVDADAAVFRDFVIRYLAANNRGLAQVPVRRVLRHHPQRGAGEHASAPG